MTKPAFEEVWRRIVAHQGEVFHMARGDELTYTVDGETLRTNRAKFDLDKAKVAQAYAEVPVDRPSDFSEGIFGESYMHAILHDDRISNGD